MAFVKLDKPAGEWVNLDYVVKVDISGDGDSRSVRVHLSHGDDLLPQTVARGLSVAEAEAAVQKLIQGAPKPQVRKARG